MPGGKSRVVARCWSVLALAVAAQAMGVAVHWTGISGVDLDWDNLSNWAEGVPTAADDASNLTAGTINHGAANNDSVKSFITNGAFNMSAGTLSAATPGVSTFEV